MKKLLTILFTLLLTVTLACVNTNNVKAFGPAEIDDVQELKDFLSITGTREGKLTGTSNYVLDEKIDIKGNKTLDLNGKTIEAENGFGNNYEFLFHLDNDSSFTINDSSKSTLNPYGKGKIDGKYSEYEVSVHGFYLNEGATLTINGGIIQDMHSKENRYGAAINNGSGTVIINDGLITDCVSTGGAAIFSMSDLGDSYVEINGGTIQKCESLYGGAIFNQGSDNSTTASLVINDGTIKDCNALSYNGFTSDGGAIYNYASSGPAELKIAGGTIKNCSTDGYGGAIINEYYFEDRSAEDAIMIITDGIIKECFALYDGGAIYNLGIATINGGTIENCTCNEYGGAIYNATSLTITGGEIKKCYSSFSAVCQYGYSLILNGDVKFDNTNDKKQKDDICLLNGALITIEDNFSQEEDDSISIWTPNVFFGLGNEYVAIEKGDSYSGTLDDLADVFVSALGQEYLIVDTDNETLNLKTVHIIEQPSFDNGYSVDTNDSKIDDPIEVSYQWYKSTIDKDTEIKGPGSYTIGTTDFDVSEEAASYDLSDNEWYLDGNDQYGDIFKISGLKKGQVLSFNFEAPDEIVYNFITLRDENWLYYCSYEEINHSGRYTATIPAELDGEDFYVYAGTEEEDGTLRGITISNIHVSERKDAKAITNATDSTLTGAEQNADNFCRIKFKNTETNVVSYVDSFDVRFGKVLEGNNQNINVGTKKDITIKFDATTNEYNYLTGVNGAVYLDEIDDLTSKLTSDTDYTATSGSIVLTLSEDFISSLATGVHTIYVKKSDVVGKECSVATLNIVNPTSSNTSVYKDESCEKIIGPTWHWNNKKGVCEEYTAVKTVTR